MTVGGGKLKKSYKIAAIAVIVALIAGAAVWIAVANSRYDVVRYSVKSDRLPSAFDGYKIVQISDLHSNGWDTLVSDTAAENPDIIAITGDLVSDDDEGIPEELVKDLVKIAPVYFVSGEAEAANANYEMIRTRLCDLGVTVLDDERTMLTVGNDSIALCGVADPTMNAANDDDEELRRVTDESLQKTVDKSSAYTVLLSHHPENMILFEAHGVDVVLAGHTHGGVVRIPLFGEVWAHGQGFMPAYAGGLFESEYTSMIVSRGLGRDGELFRVNCPYELVICTLTQG